MIDEFNSQGLWLLCEVIRERVALLLCQGCGQPLDETRVEVGEVAVDHVVLDVICCSCETRFQVRVAPASEGGVAAIQ